MGEVTHLGCALKLSTFKNDGVREMEKRCHLMFSIRYNYTSLTNKLTLPRALGQEDAFPLYLCTMLS